MVELLNWGRFFCFINLMMELVLELLVEMVELASRCLGTRMGGCDHGLDRSF